MAITPRPFSPASAVPGGAPDPMAALAQLLGVAPDDLAASHMGPSAGATSYSPDVQAASDLQGSRESQLDTMKKGIATEARYPKTFASGASPVDVARIETDLHDSPTTGDAEQARVSKMQQLSDFFLPGAEQQRAELAKPAQDLEKLKTKGALDVANATAEGRIQAGVQTQLAKGAEKAAETAQRGIIPGTNVPVPAKLSADSSRSLVALRKTADLINQLEPLLDPKAGGLMNWMHSGVNWMSYKAGLSDDPKTMLRDQLSGLIEVAGSSPYASGSRNYQYMKQAMTHLTNPAATDANLYNQVQGLKQILPGLQRDILLGEAQPGGDLGLSPSPSAPIPGQGQ